MKPIRDLTEDELAQLVRRAAELPDAPDALIRAAIELLPAQAMPTLADVARDAVKRIVATLTFDSWAQPATALGVRGVRAGTRQMLFSAAGRDVDLRTKPSAGAFSISGQVLGPDYFGRIEVSSDTGADTISPRFADLDDLGEFRLDGLPAGTYTLTLRVHDAEIELPAITLDGEAT